MSLLRKLRRQVRRNNGHVERKRFALEQLEPRLMLNADLQVADLFIDPMNDHPYAWGDSAGVDMNVVVENTGDSLAAGAATVSFYLSDDATLDVGTDALLAGSLEISDLEAGGAYPAEADSAAFVSVALPGPGEAGFSADGDKYLFAVVDSGDAIVENDETNNSAAVQLAVGTPWPVVGSDLVVDDAALPEEGTLKWGNTYTIWADVWNAGNRETETFTVDVVLSADGVYGNGDDVSVLAGGPLEVTGGLAAGAENEDTSEVQLVLPAWDGAAYVDGEYALFMVADSGQAVAEVYESNNVACGFVTIEQSPATSAGVDLATMFFEVEDLDEGPAELVWGQTYEGEFALMNGGDTGILEADADFTVSVVLSENMVYGDGSDVEVGSLTVTGALDSYGLLMEELDVTLPSSFVNPNYLVLTADRDGIYDDANEANNVWVVDLAEATFVGADADIAVQGMPGESMDLGWGQTYQLPVMLENQGNTIIGTSFDVNLVLSPDGTYEASPSDDQVVGTVTVTFGVDEEFDPGQWWDETVSVTLPAAGATYGSHTYGSQEDYWLFAVVDTSGIAGEDASNNVMGSQGKVLSASTLAGPQLFVSMVDMDNGSPDYMQGPLSYLWTTGSPYVGGFSAEVSNEGTDAVGTFDVTVRLSEDPYYDESDVVVASRTVNGLPGLGVDNTPMDLTIPAETAAGPYYLVTMVDSGNSGAGVIAEEEEGDNVAPMALSVHVGELLAGTELLGGRFDMFGAESATWGSVVNVDGEVRNAGDTASGGFTVSYYLSVDDVVDGGDELLGSGEVDGVGAGAQWFAGNTELTLPGPGTLADGTYNLIMAIDSGGAIAEADETNNTWSMPLAIGGGGGEEPDLEVQAVNWPVETVWDPGAVVTLDTTVGNVGAVGAGQFDVSVYLSTDDVPDGSDMLLATRTVTELAAGTPSNAPMEITIPADTVPGDYFLYVVADNTDAVAEGNETNNIWLSPLAIGVAPEPDLEVQDVTWPVETVWDPGAVVTLDTMVSNVGAAAAGQFDVSVYLSTDDVPDGSDVLLAARTVTELAAGTPSNAPMEITIPADTVPGDYFLYVVADDAGAVAEGNETNNIWLSPLAIGGGGGEPDLQVETVNWPVETVWDQDVSVTLETGVRNIGTGAAGEFDVRVYLSADDVADGSDVLLATRTVTELAAGLVSDGQMVVTIPTETVSGEYFLCVVADAGETVAESDEQNNAWTDVIAIDPQADLVAGQLQRQAMGPEGSSAVGWGESLDLMVEVANEGMLATGVEATVAFYLSADGTLDVGADVLLAETLTVVDLGPEGYFNAPVSLALPVTGADGDYYVFMVVDSDEAVVEGDESNNVGSLAVGIGTSEPAIGVDLQAQHVSLPGIPLRWGQSYPVHFGVNNGGNRGAGLFAIDVVLSSDKVYGNGDEVSILAGGVVTVAEGLMAGEWYDGTGTITLPGIAPDGDGSYGIFLVVDSGEAVVESFESNNTSMMVSDIVSELGVTPGEVDLQALDLFVDAWEGLVWGQTYAGQALIQNIGETDIAEVDADFAVSVVLSENEAYEAGSDLEVGSLTVSGALGSGGVLLADVSMTLPASFTNGNFLLLVADRDGVYDDPEVEGNNVAVLDVGPWGGIQEPMVDVTPLEADMPEDVPMQWGGSYIACADALNVGNTVVSADFDLALYLSPDEVLDGDDWLLTSDPGVITVTEDLEPGDEAWNDVLITLPTTSDATTGGHTFGAEGQDLYWLFVVADEGGAIAGEEVMNNAVGEPVWIVAGTELASPDLRLIDFELEMEGGDYGPEEDGQDLAFLWTKGVAYTGALDAIVYNEGTAAESFEVTVRLSSDPFYDETDVVVGSRTVNGLGSLAFDDAEMDLTIPADTADGPYFLVTKVDSGAAVTEADESNNECWAVPVQVGELLSGVDLLGNELGIEGGNEVTWGDTNAVLFADVRNAGDEAIGPFTVQFYLSEDGVAEAGEELAGTEVQVDRLGAGEVLATDVMNFVPAGGTLANGTYNLIMVIDADGEIAELDEANNTFSMPLTIGGSEPDLQVETVNWPVETVWDQDVSVTLETGVRNFGAGAAGEFDVRVYLSEDDVADGSDVLLATRTVTELAAGLVSDGQMVVTIPTETASGEYFLCVVADAGETVAETDEQNNVWADKIAIDPQPDLAVMEMHVPMDHVIAGDMIHVEGRVANMSPVGVEAYEFAAVLSTDDVFDASDVVLGRLTDMIMPGEEKMHFLDVNVPGDVAEGAYYIGFVVDPDNLVEESDEANNSLFSMPVQVEAAIPDLMLGHFEVWGMPLSMGDMFTVANEIRNESDFDAGPFTVTFVLSADEVIDGSDMVLGERILGGLWPWGGDEQHNDLVIPNDGSVAPGEYFLGVIVDSQGEVVERNEENNVVSMPISIMPPDIDLIVAWFDPHMGGPLVWGDSFGVTADVRNDGPHEAPATEATIYLSGDGLLDGGDVVLTTLAIEPLGGGGLSPHDLMITLPGEAGAVVGEDYHLIMEVDSGAVAEETFEDNNVWVVPLGIETPVVDLVVPGPPPGEEPPMFEMLWGLDYELPLDAFNEGNGTVGPFTISMYLSENPTYEPGDMELASVVVDGLGPWQDSFNEAAVQLPGAGVLADGTYYLVMFADSGEVIEEGFEDNNMMSMPVNISEPNFVEGVDLQIKEFFFEMGENVGWGQSYEVVADVFNSGDTTAGVFEITIALSSDNTFDVASDTVIGVATVDGLASGGVSINDIMVTLPEEGVLPDGAYRVFMVIDGADVVEEVDELNNSVDFIINIGQSGADLALMDIFMPFDAAWGSEIVVDAWVENWGSLTVGSVDVAFYLSEDWVWDAEVDELLATTTLESLGGGEGVMTSATITLPESGEQNMLRVIGVVDPANTIEEFDEQFNNMLIRDVSLGERELSNLMAWPMIVFEPDAPNVDWGSTLTLDTMVDNMSPLEVEAFTVKYYLSQDEQVGTDDVVLGRSDVSGMMPFEHQSLMGVSLKLPNASPAEGVDTWHVLAKADSEDVIEEMDEMDNTGWAPLFIGSMPADLWGSMYIDFSDGGQVFWGDDVTLELQIENSGESDASGFEVAYYLSNDPELSDDDVMLGEPQLIELVEGMGNSGLLTHTLTLPVEPLDAGNMMAFIVAAIDYTDTVDEVDEWNNQMAMWFAGDVSASDLVAFKAEPLFEPGEFMAWWSDSVTTNAIDVAYEFANFGNEDAADFTVEFYLTNATWMDFGEPVAWDGTAVQTYLLGQETVALLVGETFDPAEPPVGEEGPFEPPMGENVYSGQMTLVLPQASDVPFVQAGNESGSYSLMMKVDGAETISEIFEDNNVTLSPLRLEMQHGEIDVTDGMNDPHDRMIDFGPVLMNEPLVSSFTVTNFGMGQLTLHDVASEWVNLDVWASDGQALPIVLGPEASVTFDVAFTANMQGHNEGWVTIYSDDPWRGPVDVQVWADAASAPIDLAVTGLEAAGVGGGLVEAGLHWGEPLDVTVEVSNLESGDTEGDVWLDLMLSENAEGTGMVFWLDGMAMPAVPGGGVTEQAVNVMLPEMSPFGYGGDLYVMAMVHPTGGEFEVDPFNNEGAALVNITSEAIGKPDLTFNWLGMPPEAAWGQPMDVALGLTNIGLADAPEFNVRYYLSTNDRLEPAADLLLGELGVAGLSAEGWMDKHFWFDLPEAGADGLHYLIAQIDADNTVEEEFEQNNVAIGRFEVTSGPSADLAAQSLNVPGEIVIGEPFTLELDVANYGDEGVANVRVEFFLADQSLPDLALGDSEPEQFLGMYIGSVMVPSLPASETGEPVRVSFDAMLPPGSLEPGDMSFVQAVVDADQMVVEMDEFNNLIASGNFTVSAGETDLAGEISETVGEAAWGENVPLALTVTNTGQIGAPPFFVDVLLSTDDVLDESDFYLTSQAIYGLGNTADGNSAELYFDLHLPEYVNTGDGDYYLMVKVDGADTVVETDEANNVVASPIVLAGTPDLSVYLEQAPFTSNFGQTISVIDQVDNYSMSAVGGAFEVSYYLSPSDVYDPASAVLVGSRTVSSLEGNGSSRATTSLTLAQGADWPAQGQFFLFAVVDEANEIDESFESGLGAGELQWNNVCWMPIEIVEEGMPDVTALPMTSLSDSAEWGEPVWVEYTIDNIGTADAEGFTGTFYLSDNLSITPRDFALGTVTLEGLDSQSSYQDAIELMLPAESPYGIDGEFYVGLLLDSDGQIIEINEKNNVTVTDGALTIGTVINVDLLAAYLDGPVFVTPGATLEFYNEVYNAGSIVSGAFDVDFYMTQGGVLDGGEVLLGSRTIESLGSGAFDAEMTALTLPESLSDAYGQMFTVVMAVNPAALADPATAATVEQYYDNNCLASMNSFEVVEPIMLDVSVADVSTVAEASWGEGVTVEFGLDVSDDLMGPVDVEFYLRDGGATWLLGGSTVGAGAGGSAETVALTLPASSPFGRDGSFEIVAVADPYNMLAEADEGNNSGAAALTVGSGKADLLPLGVSTAPKASAGDAIDVYNDVRNVGSQDAGGFDVYFYLTSGNTTIDTSTDRLLGMRQVMELGEDGVALPSGEVNWTITSLAIPSGLADGDYYLAMVVDKFDDVDEANEDNNVIFSESAIKVKTVTVEPDAYEPNNSQSSAKAVTLDEQGQAETLSATLHDSNDLDYYRFTTPANADGFARVELFADEMLNGAVLVYNSSGTLIGGADNDSAYGGDETFTTFALGGGRTYTVLVKALGESSGSYELALEVGLGTAGDPYETNETASDAYYLGKTGQTLWDASVHTGTDVDYYQFVVPATSTGLTTVSVETDPTLDAVLQLYDADNVLVASADNTGVGALESITFEGTIGADYYACVSAWAESVGGYRFGLAFEQALTSDAYEPNDDRDSAHHVGEGDLILTDPVIHNKTDVDYYRLTVPGQTSALEAVVFGAGGLDASLALYDAEGVLLRSVDRAGGNGEETLLFGDLRAGEDVYLAVSGVDTTTGRYGLEVAYGTEDVGDVAEPNNRTTSAYELGVIDGTVTVEGLSVHNEADRDYFSFVVPDDSDGTASIRVKPVTTTSGLNAAISVLDSEGTLVSSTDAATVGETETLRVSSGLAAGQTYFIDVNGWGTTGEYTLTVQTPVMAAAHEATPSVSGMTEADSAWGLTSYGYLPSTLPAAINVVEEVGNPNDDDLSFGMVASGSSSTGQVVLLNTGASDLVITDMATDNEAFALPSSLTDALPLTIEASGSYVLDVSFNPTTQQLYSGASLTISSNDEDTPEYTLALSGTGTVSSDKPDIVLSDTQGVELSSLSFEDTVVDGSSTMTIRIGNTGAASLDVTSASLSGAGADAFQVVQTNLANKSSDNYGVAADGQRAIQVKFLPTDTGAYNATLTLTSNDPDESSVVIPLTGSGAAPELVVDLNPADGTVANALNPSVVFGEQVADGAGGQRGEYPISIVNTGTTALTISGIAFGEEAGAFSIIGDGVDLAGFTVEPGESIGATLVFDPQALPEGAGAAWAVDAAAYGDTMTVYSDDFDSPVMRFSLSGQAIEPVVVSVESTGEFYYTEPDGDEVLVTYNGSGAATFTFDSDGLDSATLTSVTLTGSDDRGQLTIVASDGNGDGAVDVGAIMIEGDFGTIKVEGDVASIDGDGSISKILVEGSLGGLDVADEVRSLSVDSLSGEVTAASFNNVTVEGDISGATITADDMEDPTINVLKVGGAVSDTSISGAINRLQVTGAVSDTSIDAGTEAIRTVLLRAGADSLDIEAGSVSSLKVTGDLLGSSLSIRGEDAQLGSVQVSGDAEINLDSEATIRSLKVGGDLSGSIDATTANGAINRIAAGGDISANIRAVSAIRNISAKGDILSSAIEVTDGEGAGVLGSLKAGGNVNVANLDVEGVINRLSAGSRRSGGNLSGAVNADDTVGTVKVFGDIFADLTAGNRLRAVTAGGSLMGDADVTCSAGDIDRVLIGERIYGTISANDGQGSIGRLRYDENTFYNPDTEQVDLPRTHINAQWL